MFARSFRCFLVLTAALAAGAVSAENTPSDEEAPLPKHERVQITTDLLQQYPNLAASPGIKSAYAPVERDGRIGIMVYFHPHAESHGIKAAYRASCAWETSDQTWSCYRMVTRRYLTLDSQDYEVRVIGDIAADVALALIEGSRRDLVELIPDDRPDTAIMIQPHAGHYAVAWGKNNGRATVSMLVQLADGGDPSNPDDWHSTIR
ncbi:MAG: hypothetical protein QNJ00_16170 [Woeseiaceae bacterium]|nr:hypothetical protein [Woeseiaceae bacterium]